ncbi:hypothetical protein HDV05_005031 [Chytridiales sp. JEL 0842]|nr:hypothetical protein HDV05_005031 [Chytridiales sp. JEL 0842]
MQWFRGKGLAFVFGLNLSFARTATALNDNISPWIVERFKSVPLAGWVGFGVCVLSFVSCLTIIYLDRPAGRRAAGVEVTEKTAKHGFWADKKPSADHEDEDGDMEEAGGERRPLLGGGNGSPSPSRVLVPSNVELARPDVDAGYESEEFDNEDEDIHCSQVMNLPWMFWMLCLTTIALYGAVVPFFHICTDFFQQKWGLDSQTAGFVMSVPDWIAAIGSPICGIFLDWYGHRGTILPLSALVIFSSHFLMQFTTFTPLVGMSIIGVAYSMFAAALWPCVPYLVGPHQIATGYGLITISLNLALFGFPLCVAHIRNFWVFVQWNHSLDGSAEWRFA